MKIKKSVQKAMRELQVDTLRKAQIAPIRSITDGYDTFVVAPTASGKSFIYQLPAVMHKERLTLVIEPTLALMHDQVQKLKALSIQAEYLDSTMCKTDAEKVLAKVKSGRVCILYVTPERLRSKTFLAMLGKVELYMVVVDECHCVLEWGEAFRSDYLTIGNFISSRKERPIITALTATVNLMDRDRIMKMLGMEHVREYVMSIDRPNLVLMKERADTPEEKLKKLKRCIKKYHQTGSIVVYCSTCAYTDAVYNYLSERFPDQVVRCHAAMKEKMRAKQEQVFLNEDGRRVSAHSAKSTPYPSL